MEDLGRKVCEEDRGEGELTDGLWEGGLEEDKGCGRAEGGWGARGEGKVGRRGLKESIEGEMEGEMKGFGRINF